MNLQNRINLLAALGNLLKKNTEEWQAIKHKASILNGWFTPEFIEVALNNIIEQFLDQDKLSAWADHYHLDDNITTKQVGIVMAGNIPLVGFHDFLCAFICGHKQLIKLSPMTNEYLIIYSINKMGRLALPTNGNRIGF